MTTHRALNLVDSLRRIVSRKAVALVLLTILILSLLPLFALSFYNRPYSDDYSYGSLTAHAWRASGSFIQVISAALEVAKNSYEHWQGTFSAAFIFALQPGIFAEKLYFITTFLLLGSLIASTFYFLYCVLVSRLKTDVWTWLIISSAVLYLSIQFVPSAAEGFYWYNGGVFYTFFYSLYLLLMGSMLAISSVKSKRRMIFYVALIALLSITIGGGNYMTALLTSLTLVLFCIAFTVQKTKNRWVCYISLLLVVTSLLVSALAPGNAIRAEALEAGGIQRLSIIDAILASFSKSFANIINWTNFQVIGVLLLMIPLMLTVVKNTEYSFRFPFLVLCGAYCLFAAQFSPPALMNVGDSGRHINIFYYSYVLMAMGCVFYCVGWFNRKLKERHIRGKSLSNVSIKPYYQFIVLLACVLLSFLVLLNANKKDWVGKTALQALLSGQAKQFAADRDERLEFYMNPDIVDAVVKPLTTRPMLFHETDLWYAEWWVNQSVAAFYDKGSVSLQD